MFRKLLAAAALVGAAAIVTGGASASHTAALQRIAISFPKGNVDSSFVLTPLASGPVKRDSGSSSACCWGRRFFQRDGQAVEVDNPLKTFVGKRGTFEWRAQVSFFDSGSGYYVSTGAWKIVGGTRVYKKLAGHGRLAGIVDPADQEVTLRAEGLLYFRG
jgi:hypothetical protein